MRTPTKLVLASTLAVAAIVSKTAKAAGLITFGILWIVCLARPEMVNEMNNSFILIFLGDQDGKNSLAEVALNEITPDSPVVKKGIQTEKGFIKLNKNQIANYNDNLDHFVDFEDTVQKKIKSLTPEQTKDNPFKLVQKHIKPLIDQEESKNYYKNDPKALEAFRQFLSLRYGLIEQDKK